MLETIVSFDPASLRNLGWARLTGERVKGKVRVTDLSAGTFIVPETDERWQVLWPMSYAIDAFLQDTKPDTVIVEQTSSFAGGFITGQVSQCMGVILSACGKYNLNVNFVSPRHVKKIVTGSGKATKRQIKKAVQQYINTMEKNFTCKFDSEHAYDALAGIFCWLLDRKLIREAADS